MQGRAFPIECRASACCASYGHAREAHILVSYSRQRRTQRVNKEKRPWLWPLPLNLSLTRALPSRDASGTTTTLPQESANYLPPPTVPTGHSTHEKKDTARATLFLARRQHLIWRHVVIDLLLYARGQPACLHLPSSYPCTYALAPVRMRVPTSLTPNPRFLQRREVAQLHRHCRLQHVRCPAWRARRWVVHPPPSSPCASRARRRLPRNPPTGSSSSVFSQSTPRARGAPPRANCTLICPGTKGYRAERRPGVASAQLHFYSKGARIPRST